MTDWCQMCGSTGEHMRPDGYCAYCGRWWEENEQESDDNREEFEAGQDDVHMSAGGTA